MHKLASTIIGWTGALALLTGGAMAQTPALSLTGGSGTPGNDVIVGVNLTPGSTPAASVQWDISYSSSVLSLVTAPYDAIGAAGSAAVKSAACNAISAGDVRCIISGLNTNGIGSGAVATITFKIAAGTTDTSTPVSFMSTDASDANGNSLGISGTGATVTIDQPAAPTLSTLNCSPATVTPPATSTCTVGLSSAALSATTINLLSNAAAAAVPASVTIGASSTSTTFTVNTTSVTTSTPAQISATLASTTLNSSVTLLPPSPALQFYTLAPCRVADTRTGEGFTGAFGPPSLASGSTREFPMPSSGCNIPSSAQAYSLNITVLPQTTLGYLTAWPTGESFPTVSTLNSMNGQVVANAAIVPAGTSGSISVFASDETNVLIDINGYFAAPGSPQALAFYPVAPCRVADTRSFGGFSGAFGPPSMTTGEAREFPVTSSSCNIPGSAQAYSLNMTASPVTTLGYLTTWPTGSAFPNVSTLNDLEGGLLANAAIVPAGTSGDIEVYVSNATDVIIDIDGYFAAPGSAGALNFYTLTPCRVADTRSYGGKTGAFGPPTMSAGSTRNFPMFSSACGIPDTAQAYSLNMTAWPPGAMEFLTTWPVGQTFPTVSTLNAPLGQVVANAAIVPAGTGGNIDLYVSNTTDIFFDINGYFAP
jgi:hypothetical protein